MSGGLVFPAAQRIIDEVNALAMETNFEHRARQLARDFIIQANQLDEATRLGRMRHKRGEYAAQILAGLVTVRPALDDCVGDAVDFADSLIRALAKPTWSEHHAKTL